MNLSAKTEYAAIAMIDLAANYGGQRPVQIKAIAQRHGIPSRFLVQILLQLKAAGLVSSTRGASGGYRLVRDPTEITLGELVAVVEGQSTEVTSNTSENSPSANVLLGTWQEVCDAQRQMLEGVTFAELVEQVRGQTENMYYI